MSSVGDNTVAGSSLHDPSGNASLRCQLQRAEANKPATSDQGSCSDLSTCIRLGSIQGQDDKTNDVIFCGQIPEDSSDKLIQKNLIFFGGDVQDYTENMQAHRDNKHYEHWNLESTAKILLAKFPYSHVYVIKPSVMHLKTFSSYENFVVSEMGNPTHSEGQKSWCHLSALLKNCARKVPHGDSSLPVDIIGFSKGCVVLNQFLYDLAEEEQLAAELIKRVRAMYWLDGGHNGGSKTWINDSGILERLSHFGIDIHSHVTPYQISDANRKWVGKEQKKFVSILKQNGAKITNVVHFADEDRSLDNHFKVLELFA